MTPRLPVEARSPSMSPLARLPLFVSLEGRAALVAGGTPAAAWKVELLSAAGAQVHVYADGHCDELLAIAAQPPKGEVILHDREWSMDDFNGMAIAVGAFESVDRAAYFSEAARRSHVPVNIIDKPALCDFSFGAIVNRSPLVIGISTDGAAPVFAQAVRARIEALLPQGFARWANAARRWRKDVQTSGLSFNARRAFWRRFTARALAQPNDDPTDQELRKLLAETSAQAASSDEGSVTLVGAGPGDPELLTLRAVRALQSADVILFDDLVSPEVLDFARREAKKMLVGKTGYGPSCKQQDINALIVRLAKAGRRVVRLKGGDPLIFSRAAEELAACRDENIPVEVVPGITTAQAVASRLQMPLTQRNGGRRLQYVSGHGADGKLPDNLDWQSLADSAATTAIYMPVRTLGDLVRRALAAGLDPEMPAIAVGRATRPDETILAATIAELPERLAAASIPGPVLVMYGRTFSGMALERSQPEKSLPRSA